MVADRDLVLAKRTQQSENQGRWVPACAGMTAGNHLRLPRPEPTGPMAAFPADATGSRPHRARLRPIQPTWTLPMPNPSEPGVTVAPTASGQPATLHRAVRSEEHPSELPSLM